MANAREIKERIGSIRQTKKVTNAMYMIASLKLRKAKRDMELARPYFNALHTEISRIFRWEPDITSHYLMPPGGFTHRTEHICCLVITAKKGLAGAYNYNVLRLAEQYYHEHPGAELFVIGDYGRRYFRQKNIPIQEWFNYSAQHVTMHEARNIGLDILEQYDREDLDQIDIFYTDFVSSLITKARHECLLPLSASHFTSGKLDEPDEVYEYFPSVQNALDNVIPSYLIGFIYSALVDSFCCEQNARMTAMYSAGLIADEMLRDLSVQYNSVRQEAITSEITEVSAGARAQRKAKQKK